MPRRPRNSLGGQIYHVLNRGVAKLSLFEKDEDYIAFLSILAELQEKVRSRLLCFCLMPNHWHLMLWPVEDGELSEYMRLLSVTHTQRWHAHYDSAGHGPIYQGRFKSFPVQSDEYFTAVARYIERNPLRANLVSRAEDWRWSSLRLRHEPGKIGNLKLNAWPVQRPENWCELVNTPQSNAELDALRLSVKKGCPFGDSEWQLKTAKLLGITSSLRDPGRPSKY